MQQPPMAPKNNGDACEFGEVFERLGGELRDGKVADSVVGELLDDKRGRLPEKPRLSYLVIRNAAAMTNYMK